MTIFWCENSILGPRLTRELGNDPFEGDHCFHFFCKYSQLHMSVMHDHEHERKAHTTSRLQQTHHKGWRFATESRLDSVVHRWVPARTPTVHRCPNMEGRGWPDVTSTRRPQTTRQTRLETNVLSGEGACFNSPECTGGSSPVGTEPLEILLFCALLLLLLLLFCCFFIVFCCCFVFVVLRVLLLCRCGVVAGLLCCCCIVVQLCFVLTMYACLEKSIQGHHQKSRGEEGRSLRDACLGKLRSLCSQSSVKSQLME